MADQIHCPNDETGVSQFVVLGEFFGQKVPLFLTKKRHFLAKKVTCKGRDLKTHFLHFFLAKSGTFGQKCFLPRSYVKFQLGAFHGFFMAETDQGSGTFHGWRWCATPQRRRDTKNFLEENFSLDRLGVIFFFFLLFFWRFFLKIGHFFFGCKGGDIFSQQ